MAKNSWILKFIAAVLLGALGGVLGCQVFLPWLAGKPFFEDIDWIKNSREGVTVINRTEKVVLTEEEGMEQAVSRSVGAVAGVSSQRTEKIVGGRKIILEKPEVLAQGTGIFISSDGLVAAPDLFVADSAQKILLFAGNRQIEAKLVKRDEKNGLVLLKAEENDLPVLPFFEGELKLGERMFLIDAKSGNASVNMGFVDSFEPNPSIFFQTSKTTGGPIFNSKGELIGLGLLQAPDGHMAVVAAKIIRELIK